MTTHPISRVGKITTISKLIKKIWAIMAKIKLPKKPHSVEMFWMKVKRSSWDLRSQADPARENGMWSYPYFN